MALLEGRARGGPRDGVKLQCPANWDGKVMLDQYNAYPGCYIYDTAIMTWVWKPDLQEESKMPARARQAFAGYKYH